MANLRSAGYQAGGAYGLAAHSGWFERLTRVGFVAKGIVYVMIGTLAFMAAMHYGGETTDKHGAVQKIAAQPFGEFALAIIGVGLLAYAAWRLIAAFKDTEHKGSDSKGMAKRIGYIASAIAYSSVAIFALKTLVGEPTSHSDGTRTWTATLLEAPAGWLLVTLVGVAVIAYGISQIRKGITEKFRNKLRIQEMSAEENRWATRAGKWGHVAKGCVAALIGVFLVYAGMNADASEARGLEGILDTIARQPFGQWMLAFVAAGLACYGVYSFVEARYRRVHMS